MQHIRRSATLLLALALIQPDSAGAQTPLLADAETVMSCVSAKAGPEGDLPSPGPLRERMLKEMEGGPAACIGIIHSACDKAGGDGRACTARESRAWLQALALDRDTPATPKAKATWKGAADRVQAQAVALCEGAAALSAWGGETVNRKGRYGMSLSSRCVREAIAQQALIMLVHVRGN